MEIKESWEKRQREIIGEDFESLREHLVKPLPVSIRINTLKAQRDSILSRLTNKGWKLKQIPFYENGFVLEEKEYAIGNTVEHFLGYIYMQEVASMIPAVALEPNEGELILDMAAAPGSKTSQIAQMINNTGAIVANEKYLKRSFSLRSNLQRCGVSNALITCMDGKRFKNISTKFDRVLLDAPCTGTGIIMKSPQTLKTWSPKTSEKAANLQKQLISSALACLKDGGILVYSTCSLEPEENEEVVDYAIQKFGVSVEEIQLNNFKIREGITTWDKKTYSEQVRKCARIYPQDNNTSGFFVARLKK